MDKSWMHALKYSECYSDGVNKFMQFVESHKGKECDIRYPCQRCLNLQVKDQTTVKNHIMQKGIDPGYVTWFYHGEQNARNQAPSNTNVGDETEDEPFNENEADEEEDDGVGDMLFDLGEKYDEGDTNDVNNTNIGSVPAYLKDLMKGAENELYPGCEKISRTSFIIQLLHLKVINKLSNKTIDMLLKQMKSSFPKDDTLPSSYYEAKKFLRDLGLGYECIHACKYDCALYWKENENWTLALFVRLLDGN